LEKPEVAEAYAALEEEFALLHELGCSRKIWADASRCCGTNIVKAPAVARIESPSLNYSPSLSTLRKYAKAVGCTLEIKLRSVSGD